MSISFKNICLVVFIGVALNGCDEKNSHEIEKGSSLAQLIEHKGKPSEIMTSANNKGSVYVYEQTDGGDKAYMIEDGKVVRIDKNILSKMKDNAKYERPSELRVRRKAGDGHWETAFIWKDRLCVIYTGDQPGSITLASNRHMKISGEAIVLPEPISRLNGVYIVSQNRLEKIENVQIAEVVSAFASKQTDTPQPWTKAFEQLEISRKSESPSSD